MARVVECEVCGKHFAVTEKQYIQLQEVTTSLKGGIQVTFICKICKKMVKTK